MILPSEDDSRKPDKSGPSDKPEDESEWWDAGESSEEGGAVDPYGDAPEVQSPAPPGWREELKAALIEAVDDLKEIEDPAEEFDPPEPPDLFTFYGELAAMRNELRRTTRRSTEALQQIAAGTAGKSDDAATRSAAMALVYLHDRIAAGEKRLLPVVESALQQAGIARVPTHGAAFDPATMVSDDTIGPGVKVTRELETGFLWNGRLLRPARVALA